MRFGLVRYCAGSALGRGKPRGKLLNNEGLTSFYWPSLRFFTLMAEWTGLEPATPGVTGRYSNQLNYHSIANRDAPLVWCVLRGSNSRHSPCKGDALPTELSTLRARGLPLVDGKTCQTSRLVYRILKRFS